MLPGRHRAASTAALLSTTALLSTGLSTGWFTASAFAAPPSQAAAHIKHLCAHATTPGHVACLAEARTDVVQHLTVGPDTTPSGYGPTDLQGAYNLPSASAGAGRTVAIVDAMDDPSAESDLAAYRSQYGLPACTTANGCFHKVNQTGGTTYPSADAGWAGEISLDLDMVSAVCPQCHITLVEASSTSTSDIGKAENEAVALGAKYVSNSFGGPEDPSETTADVQYFNHPGVAITVSAGDSGYGAQYPASSPYVTAVGGTSLSRAGNTRGWSESVWWDGTNGTGSGCSADEAKPTWQSDTGCTRRTVADVSAVADPATGVAVYDTYGASGWNVYGGTSASSPIIAATYALAGTPTANSYPSTYPYGHTSALNDVTTGSDGSCSPAYLCTAGTGYDGPTGLGTPNGTAAFAGGANTVNSLQPGQKLTSGHKLSSANITLTMGSDGNLVAYLKTNGTSGSGPAIWSSHTSGHSGAYAYMQSDGNLVVYSSTGTALWSTHTNGHSGAYFLVQEDGNLVVYGPGGGPGAGGALWSDGTYARSAKIGSGQKLQGGWWTQTQYTRLVVQPDGNFVMYRKHDGKALWSTGTYGHSGAYAYMQSDGNLVVYSSTGTALWSTHTYGHSGAYAEMQSDGNFVVYTATGGPGKGGALWASNTTSYMP